MNLQEIHTVILLSGWDLAEDDRKFETNKGRGGTRKLKKICNGFNFASIGQDRFTHDKQSRNKIHKKESLDE